MKKLLLIDDSLTVQKVVSLTLDKNEYAIRCAKNRVEAMRSLSEEKPDLVLVSDQVSDISAGSFPREVEVWMGSHEGRLPSFVLISNQPSGDVKNYAAVLKKPFSPGQLQTIVREWTHSEDETATNLRTQADPLEEQFNSQFADEARLTEETLRAEEERVESIIDDEPTVAMHHPLKPPKRKEREDSIAEALWNEAPSSKPAKPANPSSLWEKPSQKSGGQMNPTTSSGLESTSLMDAEESMAYKRVLEGKVEETLQEQDLAPLVDKVLDRIVPPIVERLVQERLDRLLKEHEQYMELNNDPG